MGLKPRPPSASSARKKMLAELRKSRLATARSALESALAKSFAKARPHQVVVLEYRPFDASSSDIGVYTFESYTPGPWKSSGEGEIIMVTDVSVDVGPRQIFYFACDLALEICGLYPNSESHTAPFFALVRDHDGIKLDITMFDRTGQPLHDWRKHYS